MLMTVCVRACACVCQLSTRFRNNVEEKMRKLGYVGVGVSAVGQRLVDTITKTYVYLYTVFGKNRKFSYC